jgi:ATP-dependent RNA helicase DHX37/DHR1
MDVPPADLPEPEGLDLDESDMDVEMIEALRGVLRHTPHLLPRLDLAEAMPPNGKKQRAALFAIWSRLTDLQRREMDALADSSDEDGSEAGEAPRKKSGRSSLVRVRAGAEGSVERRGLSSLARSIVDLMDGAGGDTAAAAGDVRDSPAQGGTDAGPLEGAAAAPAAAPATAPILVSARSAAAGPCSRTGAFYVPVDRTEAVSRAREQLPIFGEEQRVMEAVTESDVVLLCGETGSGKTTQVPQFLYEAGYGHPDAAIRRGMVGVTQPRRVAAVAMAQRVAHELNMSVGGEVAYQVGRAGSLRAGFALDG